MSSDPSETYFFTCACPLCAGSVGGFSADGDTVTGGASAPPTFTLPQIQTQLRTQWGGNQEGKTWTWLGTTNVTYSIDANVSGPSEASGLVGMTTLMEDRARLAFELWDDLIALSLDGVRRQCQRQHHLQLFVQHHRRRHLCRMERIFVRRQFWNLPRVHLVEQRMEQPQHRRLDGVRWLGFHDLPA